MNYQWLLSQLSILQEPHHQSFTAVNSRASDILRPTGALAKLDERLSSAYERLRSNAKNGLAVVAVDRDSCGGCFNQIPPQRQLDIQSKKKLIVCGFHEATLAAYGCAAHIYPGQTIHLQYTTTSPKLHEILGVTPQA